MANRFGRRAVSEGTVSIGRAAQIADVSIWRLLDILDDRGVEANDTESDLASDLADVREE